MHTHSGIEVMSLSRRFLNSEFHKIWFIQKIKYYYNCNLLIKLISPLKINFYVVSHPPMHRHSGIEVLSLSRRFLNSEFHKIWFIQKIKYYYNCNLLIKLISPLKINFYVVSLPPMHRHSGIEVMSLSRRFLNSEFHEIWLIQKIKSYYNCNLLILLIKLISPLKINFYVVSLPPMHRHSGIEVMSLSRRFLNSEFHEIWFIQKIKYYYNCNLLILLIKLISPLKINFYVVSLPSMHRHSGIEVMSLSRRFLNSEFHEIWFIQKLKYYYNCNLLILLIKLISPLKINFYVVSLPPMHRHSGIEVMILSRRFLNSEFHEIWF